MSREELLERLQSRRLSALEGVMSEQDFYGSPPYILSSHALLCRESQALSESSTPLADHFLAHFARMDPVSPQSPPSRRESRGGEIRKGRPVSAVSQRQETSSLES